MQTEYCNTLTPVFVYYRGASQTLHPKTIIIRFGKLPYMEFSSISRFETELQIYRIYSSFYNNFVFFPADENNYSIIWFPEGKIP